MDSDDLLAVLRRHGVTPAGKLATLLGVSRATLLRRVRSAGNSVLAGGLARRTCYAARRPLRGSLAPLPVFRIDPAGTALPAGSLHLAHPHASLLEGADLADWPLDADMRDGWFDGIPWPLQDLRPEGFLGRAFARSHSYALQLPTDPREWNDDDVLHALALFGCDAPGCFLLGEPALRLWQARQREATAPITERQLPAHYTALAESALAAGPATSSAAGEFAKFTAWRACQGEAAHMLVKFSGKDDAPGSRRWADLLVCEHLALECAARLPGVVAADSRVLVTGGRTFLESLRFDRHGASGRSPVCSWGVLRAAWLGTATHNWAAGARELRAAGLIGDDTRRAIERTWLFGRLIGNSDMHEGNLSFRPAPHAVDGYLALAPLYDMLPMQYAPRGGVEPADPPLAVELPLPGEEDPWHEAATAALAFWESASTDARISEAFRARCAANAEGLATALRG